MTTEVMAAQTFGAERIVGRAPTKLTLTLQLRPTEQGDHEIDTVLQAIDLYNYVELRPRDDASTTDVVATLDIVAPFAVGTEPRDHRNIVHQAINRVAECWRQRHPHARPHAAADPSATQPVACRRVDVIIYKQAPIAGGLGSSAADAAAALTAARELFPIPDADLTAIAHSLGRDVPFCLAGGTVRQRTSSHGLEQETLLSRSQFHWALGLFRTGLRSTYIYDHAAHHAAHRASDHASDGELPTSVPHGLHQALIAGDVHALAPYLRNQLQPTVVSIQPSVRAAIDAGYRADAVAAMVCDSGPTLAFLCRDRGHAIDVVTELCASGTVSSGVAVTGQAPASHCIRPAELDTSISAWRDAHTPGLYGL